MPDHENESGDGPTEEDSTKKDQRWIAIGLALGTGLGAAFGNVGVGIAVGIAIGAGIMASGKPFPGDKN